MYPFSSLERQFYYQKDAFKANTGGAWLVVGLFLNCPFWGQKYPFKPKK